MRVEQPGHGLTSPLPAKRRSGPGRAAPRPGRPARPAPASASATAAPRRAGALPPRPAAAGRVALPAAASLPARLPERRPCVGGQVEQVVGDLEGEPELQPGPVPQPPGRAPAASAPPATAGGDQRAGLARISAVHLALGERGVLAARSSAWPSTIRSASPGAASRGQPGRRAGRPAASRCEKASDCSASPDQDGGGLAERLVHGGAPAAQVVVVHARAGRRGPASRCGPTPARSAKRERQRALRGVAAEAPRRWRSTSAGRSRLPPPSSAYPIASQSSGRTDARARPSSSATSQPAPRVAATAGRYASRAKRCRHGSLYPPVRDVRPAVPRGGGAERSARISAASADDSSRSMSSGLVK